MVVQIAIRGQEMFWRGGLPKLASDSVNQVVFEFIVLSDWDGFDLVAQFSQNGKTFNKVVTNGKAKMPVEIGAGRLEVSVFGTSGTERRNTVVALETVVRQSGFKSDGQTPIPPTPDLYDQLLQRIDAASGEASESAKAAAESAKAAAGSAKAAAGSVEEAESLVTGAVTAISTERDEAVRAVNTAGGNAVQAVNTAGNSAVQAVQAAQTTAVGAVNDAGDAKIEQIEQINALVPTPTPEDAGKVVVVEPDGTGYELGDVQTDSYTKAESDARYAPIESALKVKCNGTGIGALAPTVPWWLQSLLIGGRTTQDGTPSPDSPVPVVSAGQSGQIDVTVAGANLIPRPYYDGNGKISNGVTFSVNDDGSIKVVGTATKQTYFSISANLPGKRIVLPPGKYIETFFGNGVRVTATAINKNTGIGRSVGTNVQFTLDKDEEFNTFIYVDEGVTVNTTAYVMLSSGDTTQPYQPYTAQQLPIPTPDGLHGIPVDSGGNWTDEKGQQWICDTIDFEAGTLTQNTVEKIFNGGFVSNGGVVNGLFRAKQQFVEVSNNQNLIPGICDRFVKGSGDMQHFNIGNGYLFIWLDVSLLANGENSTISDVNQFLSENPMTVLAQRSSPITTTLDAETIAAYAALQSCDGTTNIIALDAVVQASAVADATEYINQQIANAIAIAKV